MNVLLLAGLFTVTNVMLVNLFHIVWAKSEIAAVVGLAVASALAGYAMRHLFETTLRGKPEPVQYLRRW